MIPLTFWLGTACAHGGAHTLTLGDAVVTVEIADEPSERSRGLMYRDTLGADDGMLFVYPDAAERSFWMHNTRIPLSIAYLDAGGRIVHMADMAPLDDTSVPSGAPAVYALEVNAGWFARHGVHVGDVVKGLPAPATAR